MSASKSLRVRAIALPLLGSLKDMSARLTRQRRVAKLDEREAPHVTFMHSDLHENDISALIVDSALEVHRKLGGAGLIERIYEEALFVELKSRGLVVQRQIAVAIWFKGSRLGNDLRLDMLVEGKVIVECKATSEDLHVHAAQALTYLRATGLHLALVINFGKPRVTKSIRRVVNNLAERRTSQ
jgi:GxxExxY protein